MGYPHAAIYPNTVAHTLLSWAKKNLGKIQKAMVTKTKVFGFQLKVNSD